jgi:hypothetical protein
VRASKPALRERYHLNPSSYARRLAELLEFASNVLCAQLIRNMLSCIDKGWLQWGCLRPVPFWGGWRAAPPPEVVLDRETTIGPDGTVPVPIDTRPGLELHGNEDHEYAITAEVVDTSRRTIVGSGQVLVARQPFRVFAWVDRGFYRSGATIHASFQAQTLDHQPVQGTGELTLLQVRYNVSFQVPAQRRASETRLRDG